MGKFAVWDHIRQRFLTMEFTSHELAELYVKDCKHRYVIPFEALEHYGHETITQPVREAHTNSVKWK